MCPNHQVEAVQAYRLIHRIHNGAQTTKSRLRSLLLSFAGLYLSKAPGILFSVRTTAVEFEVVFAILQFYIACKSLPSLDLVVGGWGGGGGGAYKWNKKMFWNDEIKQI